MEVNQINSIQFKSNQIIRSQILYVIRYSPSGIDASNWKATTDFPRLHLSFSLARPTLICSNSMFFFGIEFNEYYNDHISFPVFARFECIFMQKMWWTIFARQYFSSCQFQKKTHELNPERNSIDVIFFNIKCITIPWNVYNILQIIDIKLSIKLLFQSIMWKSFGNSLKLVSISPHFITNRKLHFHQAKKNRI